MGEEESIHPERDFPEKEESAPDTAWQAVESALAGYRESLAAQRKELQDQIARAQQEAAEAQQTVAELQAQLAEANETIRKLQMGEVRENLAVSDSQKDSDPPKEAPAVEAVDSTKAAKWPVITREDIAEAADPAIRQRLGNELAAREVIAEKYYSNEIINDAYNLAMLCIKHSIKIDGSDLEGLLSFIVQQRNRDKEKYDLASTATRLLGWTAVIYEQMQTVLSPEDSERYGVLDALTWARKWDLDITKVEAQANEQFDPEKPGHIGSSWRSGRVEGARKGFERERVIAQAVLERLRSLNYG